jgi:Ribonuclease toxin, BrnT, of type II toxin-antitoxin system
MVRRRRVRGAGSGNPERRSCGGGVGVPTAVIRDPELSKYTVMCVRYRIDGGEVYLGSRQSRQEQAQTRRVIRTRSGDLRGSEPCCDRELPAGLEHEQRYQAIGLSREMLLLAVVFVDRSESEEGAVIRLISARKANQYETFLYQTGAAV